MQRQPMRLQIAFGDDNETSGNFTSDLVQLSYFDPNSSSTSSSISCSAKRCSSGFTRCNDNRCGYRLHYGDDNETSGNFTSDLVQLSYFDPNSSSTSSSISCSAKRCSSGFTRCNDNRCGYRLHYGVDNETSGNFTSDLVHFTSI
ncbi:hypothetical protein RIF29_28637 [Crotalaria pallida]|uniref:Uncharacterized protein n=1 Tax=Crotalaria pallida TaxID=3830 RepID=A0AAN9EDB9_CROPI